MRLSTFVLPLLIAASLSACKRDHAPLQDAAQAAPGATDPAGAAAPATPAEAKPAPAAAPAPLAAVPSAKPFDVQSVPVSAKALPPFPYVALPSELGKHDSTVDKDLEFDRMYVMAGEEMRRVEGKIHRRRFDMRYVKWSPLAAHRNYEAAMKELGATRVDTVHPTDKHFVARNGGDNAAIFSRMGQPWMESPEDAELPNFEQWLIRTPQTNIWLSFTVENGTVYLLTVEEKALQQTVQSLPAA